MRNPTLLTLATYNEAENLPKLVDEIVGLGLPLDVLVIDDNSPDGTGRLADQLAQRDSRFHVIHREGKLGLGSAILAGMSFAIEHGYDNVLNLDADFSHHPRYIPALLSGMDSNDVMIGSRYVRGGGVEGWPLHRKLMSWAINTYARLLLGLFVKDTSGAYRCYSTALLKKVDFSRVLSRGYSFQEEILYWCRLAGGKMAETPIVFEDRRYGKSKINSWEAVAALGILLRLGLRRLWPFS